ncbi:hypothetical protein Anapl_00619 [Anas platyrhynchos]|uniref:Uncharacterized protein n=1 Tax=Anas platyrhynchos TaxID=8839 RepID=R0LS90_ANAPL|nr:hypothetical protein Anapl_00619 [Anas platyrhynchos]
MQRLRVATPVGSKLSMSMRGGKTVPAKSLLQNRSPDCEQGEKPLESRQFLQKGTSHSTGAYIWIDSNPPDLWIPAAAVVSVSGSGGVPGFPSNLCLLPMCADPSSASYIMYSKNDLPACVSIVPRCQSDSTCLNEEGWSRSSFPERISQYLTDITRMRESNSGFYRLLRFGAEPDLGYHLGLLILPVEVEATQKSSLAEQVSSVMKLPGTLPSTVHSELLDASMEKEPDSSFSTRYRNAQDSRFHLDEHMGYLTCLLKWYTQSRAYIHAISILLRISLLVAAADVPLLRSLQVNHEPKTLRTDNEVSVETAAEAVGQALVRQHTSVCFEGREHQQQPQHFWDIIAWSLRGVLRAVELAIKVSLGLFACMRLSLEQNCKHQTGTQLKSEAVTRGLLPPHGQEASGRLKQWPFLWCESVHTWNDSENLPSRNADSQLLLIVITPLMSVVGRKMKGC